MQAVIAEAAARHVGGPSREPGQRHHAADRRRDSRDAGARPRSTASRCACSSGRARTGTPACRPRRRAAACSDRRCAARISSRYGIDDVLHGAALGLRSILVADLGQLQMLGQMKQAGDLPADFVLKISVTLAAANPATARLLEDLGATSINLPVDLSLPQIAAIRQAIDARDRLLRRGAGRLRRHRAPLRNRGARPRRRADLSEVRPAQFAGPVSERPAHRGDGASRCRASACAAPRSAWPSWRGSMPDAKASPIGNARREDHRRPHDRRRHAVARARVSRARDRHRPRRHERSPDGQPHRHAASRASTSWRRGTSSAPIRSTSSGSPGTFSARNTTGPAKCRSRRWPASTSPAGT